MKTKIVIKFINTYSQVPDDELCHVDVEEDDNIIMLAISDIYNCGHTKLSYFATAKNMLDGNLRINDYKYINISDKAIDTGNYEKEIRSIFDFLKCKVSKSDNPELIVFTNGSSEEIRITVMSICLWLKHISPELPITVDGKTPNLNKEKLDEYLREYTQDEFCKRISEVI